MSDESVHGTIEVDIAMTQRADSLTAPSEFQLGYYGWRVVLAACLGVMAGFGSLFVYTFSVFVKPLAAQFGWSREAISSGFAVAAVTLGFISPLLGRWIDRFGPRRIILICMTVYVCAIASLSLLRSGLWQFYLTCFVEDDQVKIERSGRKVVGNGKRAHHEDGLDGLDGMPSFEHESADREESPLPLEFPPEHANLTRTAASRE